MCTLLSAFQQINSRHRLLQDMSLLALSDPVEIFEGNNKVYN
jgi:hypothetical protein